MHIVVNCTANLNKPRDWPQDIQWCRYDVNNNMWPQWRILHENAITPLVGGSNVLVHCKAGCHRAGATAVLMVAFIRRMSIDDAFEIVRRQRGIIGIRHNVAELRRVLAWSQDHPM